MKMPPALRIFEHKASVSATDNSKCSGAMRLATFGGLIEVVDFDEGASAGRRGANDFGALQGRQQLVDAGFDLIQQRRVCIAYHFRGLR
jgi:hypothetical protein